MNQEKFKLIVVGDPKVGKTAICTRHYVNNFQIQYTATVGTSFYPKNIILNLESGEKVPVQQDVFVQKFSEFKRDLPLFYIRGVKGILLTFDLTKKETFDGAKKWLQLIKKTIRDFDTPLIYLVATKVDLIEERKVTSEEAIQFATENNFKYYETSSKDGVNVSSVFYDITKECYLKSQLEQQQQSVTLQSSSKTKGSMCF